MNVGKSIKVALAMRGMKQIDLARQIEVSEVYMSRIANTQHAGMGTVTKLAAALGMPVSEFIALGEVES